MNLQLLCEDLFSGNRIGESKDTNVFNTLEHMPLSCFRGPVYAG